MDSIFNHILCMAHAQWNSINFQRETHTHSRLLCLYVCSAVFKQFSLIPVFGVAVAFVFVFIFFLKLQFLCFYFILVARGSKRRGEKPMARKRKKFIGRGLTIANEYVYNVKYIVI